MSADTAPELTPLNMIPNSNVAYLKEKADCL